MTISCIVNGKAEETSSNYDVLDMLQQLGSDDAPDTEWRDTGRIYYWIRSRDLAKRDFSAVELILQST